MKNNNLRKKTYELLLSIAALIVLIVLIKTGVFYEATSWLGAKAIEPLNLK